MSSLLLTSLVAFAASLVLTAVVRAAARHWGIVDLPDGVRKLHGPPRPLWGGVAVYGAMVLALLSIHLGLAEGSAELTALSTAWMVAAGFVCFVGSIDDLFDLHPRLKLALQIISVLPIVCLGYHVDRIVAFGCPIDLGWLGIPLTVLWLVGCINALNLIDGMDGLASIVGMSTAAMLGAIAASEGHAHVAIMAVVLAGALAGFLIYNLPPASIFLGDSGSMVIGLTVGVLGIQGAMKTSATLAITAPAVVMTLPMFDIAAALVRRKLTGRPFDTPDRLHIHHRLLNRGWTPWQVLCTLGALCLTTGAAATAATLFRRDALAWITAMTLVVLLIRLRLFGYEEFAMAKEAVRNRIDTVRVWLRGKRSPATRVSAAKLDALSCTEVWELLIRDVPRWRVHQVELTLSHDQQPRRIRWFSPAAPADADCRWSVAVSLPGARGAECKLRVGSVDAMASKPNLSALTTLLKTYGTHFAAHGEQMFGPSIAAEETPPRQKQRKAA
jgi:UDP-GlcNAc:undecaprenyl-phosphate/decaprenyl-phosphate GlcNAc-1-phosphate transferase